MRYPSPEETRGIGKSRLNCIIGYNFKFKFQFYFLTLKMLIFFNSNLNFIIKDTIELYGKNENE